MELSRIKDKPYFIWCVIHMANINLCKVYIYPYSSTNALTGEGLQEGIQWLSSMFTKLCSIYLLIIS